LDEYRNDERNAGDDTERSHGVAHDGNTGASYCWTYSMMDYFHKHKSLNKSNKFVLPFYQLGLKFVRTF